MRCRKDMTDHTPFTADACQRFLDLTVLHPVALKYPLRHGYPQAVVKRFMLSLHDMRSDGVSADDGDGDAADDLIGLWYATECSKPQGDASAMSYKTFELSPMVEAPREPALLWAHIAVGPQFTNVGLSLWPSAYILVLLVMRSSAYGDVWGHRCCADGPVVAQRRAVELGAGVGLTGVAAKLLHAYASWRCSRGGDEERCAGGGCDPPVLVLTDYQEAIVDNARVNVASGCALETLCGACLPAGGDVNVDLLDWMDFDANATKWCRWAPNVILAADCVYDTSVVGGLVASIAQGLGASSAGGRQGSCAIVVQTHRQRETMQTFFDSVSAACMDVESFQVQLSGDHGVEGSGACAQGELKFVKLPHPLASFDVATSENDSKPLDGRLVGPFYIEMVELICVHRLTLREPFNK